jgi:hypothetical protein
MLHAPLYGRRRLLQRRFACSRFASRDPCHTSRLCVGLLNETHNLATVSRRKKGCGEQRERESPMCKIDELTVLLRVRVELPAGLMLKNAELCEGWNFARTGGAIRLEKKIKTSGWHFIKIADQLMRSGVGASSQEAIAGALRMCLRCVSRYFNAVGIEQIALTQYSWFFLARVTICPYRIQQGAILPVPDEAISLLIPPQQGRSSSGPRDVYPPLGCAIHLLKDARISS